jgi:hypothetical protein
VAHSRAHMCCPGPIACYHVSSYCNSYGEVASWYVATWHVAGDEVA